MYYLEIVPNSGHWKMSSGPFRKRIFLTDSKIITHKSRNWRVHPSRNVESIRGIRITESEEELCSSPGQFANHDGGEKAESSEQL